MGLVWLGFLVNGKGMHDERVSEWLDARTWLSCVSSENGGRRPGAKECGQHLDARISKQAGVPLQPQENSLADTVKAQGVHVRLLSSSTVIQAPQLTHHPV